MNTTIICIGNQLVAEDSAGPAVYEYLMEIELPEEIEVVDGGTAGLNLIPLLERDGRVIIVDSVSGFTGAGKVILLGEREAAAHAAAATNGHDVDLAYVLSVFPKVCEGVPPSEILVVGIEGPWTREVIEKAGGLCLDIWAGKLSLETGGKDF